MDCGIKYVEDNRSGPGFAEDDNDIDASSQTSRLLARRGTQKNPPWTLIDLGSSEKNPTDLTYNYVDNPGQGVDVYILDSGINHPLDDFLDDDGNTRVFDAINFSISPVYTDDAPTPGHGTRVASAIGGTGYGVAKAAFLHNVKFEQYGRIGTEGFVLAIREVVRRHNERKTQNGFKGSIINMSFSMPRNKATDQQLTIAYNADISLVASAGNRRYDAAHYPSSHPRVISVAARGNEYTPWQDTSVKIGSNYGENMISLWAPGWRVPVTGEDGAEWFATGTSFATAYVSGILATFYGVEGPNMDPALALTRLMAQTDDWIDLPDDGTD